MQIIDTVYASELEDNDQVVIDDNPIEVKSISPDPDNEDQIIIRGYSHLTDDVDNYPVNLDDRIDLWAV